jgi:hypothetical protein
MTKINIDELCQPIEVVVGGKTYSVEDISRETAKKMEAIGAGTKDSTDLNPLAELMAEVLGADKADIAKLGMRKLLMLVTKVMGAVNEEIEGKNAPKAGAVK